MTDQSNDTRLSRRTALLGLGALAVVGLDPPSAIRRVGVLSGASAAAASNVCFLMQEVTQGPYYLDETSLVRQDVTEGKAGMPLSLTLTMVNNSTCASIEGAVVEMWHADATGTYSGYSQPGGVNTVGQTFLRGAQVSDGNGSVMFTTIYPGWYSGRAVHIHVKLHVGGNVHTGQLFFPEDVTDTVYTSSPYNSRGPRTTTNSTDSVYAISGSIAVVTISQSGSGYAASNLLGVTDAGNSTGTSPDTVTPTTAPASVGPPSAFVALAVPARLLDTRQGIGYSGSKPAAGATVTLAVAGRGGIPASNVSAVVLNVSATEATAVGFVTV